MPPPALVVEVMSPSQANAARDYRYKRSEYSRTRHPGLLIVDPGTAQIAVLTLVNGFLKQPSCKTTRRAPQYCFPPST